MAHKNVHQDAAKQSDELTEFKDWYFSEPRYLFVPSVESIHFVDTSLVLCVYRHGQYQVELAVCKPSCEIPDHVHPNVDSFEVYLGGEIMFRHRGQLVVSENQAYQVRDNGLSLMWGHQIRVKPDDWHGATIGRSGGVFLSIQRWLNGLTPTTVIHDWSGKPLGSQHDSMLTEVICN